MKPIRERLTELADTWAREAEELYERQLKDKSAAAAFRAAATQLRRELAEGGQPHRFHADPWMPDTCGICWKAETDPIHIGDPIP